MRRGIWLLYVVGIACIAIAISYPIRYGMEEKSVEEGVDRLRRMKAAVEEAPAERLAEEQTGVWEMPDGQTEVGETAPERAEDEEPAIDERSEEQGTDGGRLPVQTGDDARAEPKPSGAPGPVATATPTLATAAPIAETATPIPAAATPPPIADATPAPTPQPTPSPTPDRRARTKAVQPYSSREKVSLDEGKILPQYREIFEENRDFVGWLTIDGTLIDYPVLQNEDSEYYLTRDFYGQENVNGQLIMDAKCDPYTPSYNLIISGHNMKNGKMFGRLREYESKGFWQRHKYVRFDTLMEEKTYVVTAAFYSADYDEDEAGFRYNADIGYAIDFEEWQREIAANRLYNTEIESQFGDEFLTLTTCSTQRRDGRFVVIARRLRDGEEKT